MSSHNVSLLGLQVTALFSSLLLLLLGFRLVPAGALVIHVPSGKVKCVTDDLRPNAISIATYRVAGDPPHLYNVSARVTDPNGDTVHLAADVKSGRFSFVSTTPGLHSACFWSAFFELGGEIEVEFEWRTGVSAPTARRFISEVAKKGKINAMEVDLKNLEDTINSIYAEMRFLREREEEAWKMNEVTNSRMGILTLLSLFICLGVAGVQIWHLKAFFKREKIL